MRGGKKRKHLKKMRNFIAQEWQLIDYRSMEEKFQFIWQLMDLGWRETLSVAAAKSRGEKKKELDYPAEAAL